MDLIGLLLEFHFRSQKSWELCLVNSNCLYLKRKKNDIKEGDSIGSNTHNTAMFHKYSPRVFFIRFSFVLRCFHDEVVSKPTVVAIYFKTCKYEILENWFCDITMTYNKMHGDSCHSLRWLISDR